MRPPRCYIRHLAQSIREVATAIDLLSTNITTTPRTNEALNQMRAGLLALDEHINNCEECETP